MEALAGMVHSGEILRVAEKGLEGGG